MKPILEYLYRKVSYKKRRKLTQPKTNFNKQPCTFMYVFVSVFQWGIFPNLVLEAEFNGSDWYVKMSGNRTVQAAVVVYTLLFF